MKKQVNNVIFKNIGFFNYDDNLKIIDLQRIELGSKQGTKQFSTCLVSIYFSIIH